MAIYTVYVKYIYNTAKFLIC